MNDLNNDSIHISLISIKLFNRHTFLLTGRNERMAPAPTTTSGAANGASAAAGPLRHDAGEGELRSYGTTHVAHGVGRISQHVFTKGQGSYLHTADGSLPPLLDITAGIGVVNLGHCHPAITKAAQEQCATLVHAQVNIGFSAPQLHLISKILNQAVPPYLRTLGAEGNDGKRVLDTVFFWNSGAEAVEAAIKLARQATGRQNIVVMQGSYHGRTFGTMAMTKSKTVYSAGFGPTMVSAGKLPRMT